MIAWLKTRLLPWVVWSGAVLGAAALWVDLRQQIAVGLALGAAQRVPARETGVPVGRAAGARDAAGAGRGADGGLQRARPALRE